jgi:hypothetical protein
VRFRSSEDKCVCRVSWYQVWQLTLHARAIGNAPYRLSSGPMEIKIKLGITANDASMPRLSLDWVVEEWVSHQRKPTNDIHHHHHHHHGGG